MEDLEQARNVSTPSDVLGKLALSENPEVAAAAAANPNTPDWALRRAGSTRPASDAAPTPPSFNSAAAKANVVAGASDAQVNRLISAQLASAIYLRAGLFLAIAILVFSSSFAIGNQMEQQKKLDCLTSGGCDGSGGTIWYVIGVVIGVGCVIASMVSASNAADHVRKAGG